MGRALLLVDLDGFKLVNDRLGHDVGDQVLVEAARRIGKSVRQCDVVARLGGDEFAIVVGTDHAEEALAVSWRIVAALSAPYPGVELPLSGSVGVTLPGVGEAFADAYRRADEALYRAKGAGTACASL
jgi:diguanylate cyclase (GGDEF)-like protein